jgi:hypothetical protein
MHHCSYCNTSFTAHRKDKKYCSNSCKQMAFLKRQFTGDTLLSKHQNVNLANHQLRETSSGQSVNPSINVLPMDLAQLKKELIILQDRLGGLIQSINHLNIRAINCKLDATSDKQPVQMEPLVENDITDNIGTQTSIKEQNVNPSNSIDVSISKAAESKTVNLKSTDEHIYKPIACKWINEIYGRVNEIGNGERLSHSSTAFGEKYNQVEWVSIHYRCLLECVITLSEMKVIEWDSIAELTNAFIFLISSTHFKGLPENYPFTENIIALNDQLKKFCLENKHNERMQFRLKFDTKKNLFLQRFELSLTFSKITFNQLQTNFKIISSNL